MGDPALAWVQAAGVSARTGGRRFLRKARGLAGVGGRLSKSRETPRFGQTDPRSRQVRYTKEVSMPMVERVDDGWRLPPVERHEDDRLPTDRLPNEPVRAFRLRLAYLHLGPTRSLTKLAGALGRQRSYLGVLSAKWEWPRFASLYDAAEEGRRAGELAEQRKEAVQQHAAAARALPATSSCLFDAARWCGGRLASPACRAASDGDRDANGSGPDAPVIRSAFLDRGVGGTATGPGRGTEDSAKRSSR